MPEIVPSSPVPPTSVNPDPTPAPLSPSPSVTPAPNPAPAGQVFGTPPPSQNTSFQSNQPPVVAQFGGSPFQSKKPSKKRLWMAIAAFAALVLLAGAGYVFAFYLPNTPGRVFNASLVNSGLALDKLIDYSKQQAQTNYQSTSFNGDLNIKSGSTNYMVNVSGAADKTGNANFAASTDLGALKLSSNLRVVHAIPNQTPDVYVQVSGIKSLLDSYGLQKYDTLDGQWIVIDHTFTGKYAANASLKAADSIMPPTAAQALDAETKVQAVNKQYLFTADKSKAVLTNEKYLGKSTQNGRTLDHYRVGYDKTRLSAYITALGTALDSSKLNDWIKSVDGGQSWSQAAQLSNLETSINNSKGDYTFELWADAKTKLISKVAFADPADKSSVVTLAQNYTGGSKYPFSLGFTGKNGSTPQALNLDFVIDTATNKGTFTLTGSSGPASVNGSFTLTPGKQAITVTAPAGAKSITSVLESFGLNGLATGGAAPADLPLVQSR